MPRPSEVDLQRHVAGATVLHHSPFDELEVPVSREPLDRAIRERWVVPFYKAVPGNLPAVAASLRPLLSEISPELVALLLAQFNWRDRQVGAFFVALCDLRGFQDLVGKLLLRSDVCFAGRAYCVALARLNTPAAVDFLQRYLRYYLTRNDLHFDQDMALAALQHLDEINGTTHAGGFNELWRTFVSDKPQWDLAKSCARFEAMLRQIDSFHEGS